MIHQSRALVLTNGRSVATFVFILCRIGRFLFKLMRSIWPVDALLKEGSFTWEIFQDFV